VNKYAGLSEWLRNSDGITNATVRRDMALIDKREAKRIEKGKNPPKVEGEKPHRVNGPVWGAGKYSETGGVLRCGRFLEIYASEELEHHGAGTDKVFPAKEQREKESQESVARRVNHRARKQIRRIVNTNDFRAMHTLTFAPPGRGHEKKYDILSIDEQSDYDMVRACFKRFIQRAVRAYGSTFAYLVVFELHDSEQTSDCKRGTWHVHLATSTDRVLRECIAWKWQHGMTDYQDYRYDTKGNVRDEEIQNPGAYMAEYIGKDGAQFGQKELINKRRYTTSRCTKRPTKTGLSEASLGGDLETVEFEGKSYKNVYWKTSHVPGNYERYKINAVYQEVVICKKAEE
jgi:hypothetical protein